MADDILLGFTENLDEVLAKIRAEMPQLINELQSISEVHPEVVVGVANSVESLRTLRREIGDVIAGVRDANGQPLTFDVEQGRARLEAVRDVLRGLDEDFLRLPDVADASATAVAAAAERMARGEMSVAEATASVRSELAATARQAEAAGAEEAASQRPFIEAANEARNAISEVYRVLANGATSIVTEFAAADGAIERFAGLLRDAADAGAPIGTRLPADLARLQAQLLAVAGDAERAGVAIQQEAEEERSAAALIAEANRIVSLSIQEVLERSRLLASEGARGWETLQGPVERARAAVQELVAVIEEARAAGSPIPPGADEQLSLFQARLERAELAALAAAEGVTGLRAAVRAEADAERAAAAEVAAAERAAAQEVAGAQRIAVLSIQEATSQTRLFRAEGGRDWPAVAAAVASARAAVDAYAVSVAHARAQGTPLAAGTAEQLALLQSRLANVTVAAEKARTSVRDLGNAGESASSGGLALLSRAFNRIAFSIELMIAYQAARKIKELAGEAAAAAEMGQRMAIGFEAAAGGAREGAEAEAFLRAEGQRLGFVVNEMAEGYIKFLTATRGVNMPLAEQQALFSRIAETMASMRAPQQQTNQLMQTFAEIIDRGAASTAQLRRRLSDELPSGMANLRAVTGLTEGDLDKMTKGGQLGAQVLLSLITRIAEEVGGGYRGAIDSAAAAEGRLKDQIQESAAIVGEKYLPALANLREELRLLVADNATGAEATGEMIRDFVTGLDEVARRARYALAVMALNRAQAAADRGELADLAEAQRQVADAEKTSADRAEEHTEKLRQEAAAGEAGTEEIIKRGEALVASGRISREEATVEVAAINEKLLKSREYDEATRWAMQEQLDRLAKLRDALTPLTVDVGAAFDQQLLSVRHFVSGFDDELKRAGTISKDAADQIVKQVKAAAVAFALLPEATRKARTEQGTELAAMLAEFERFTTGYEKLGDRQAKAAERVTAEEAKQEHAREKNLEESERRLASIIEKPIAKAEGQDLSGAQKSLAQQQAELAALQAKPLNTSEDLNRMEELRLSIDHQTEAVKKLQQAEASQGSAALESASAQVIAQGKVHQAIANLITEDDKFKESFLQLGPEAQAAVQRIITSLDQADKAGTVTGDDVTTALRQMNDVFVQAGVLSADFANRLRADIDPTRTLGQMFDAIKTSGTAGAQALSEVAKGAGQVASAAPAAAAASRTVTAAMKEQADEAAAVAAADRGAGLASADLGGKTQAAVAAFQAEAAAQRASTQAASQLEGASISLGRHDAEMTGEVLAGGEALRGSAQAAGEKRDIMFALTDAEIEGQRQLDKSTESEKTGVEQTAKGTAIITISTQRRKDDSTAVTTQTEKSKSLTTELKNEGTAVETLTTDLPKLVSGHDQAGAAADKASGSLQKGATAMGQEATAAGQLVAPLASVAASMEKIAEADPGTALQAAADANKQLLDSAGPLAEALDKEDFYIDRLDAIVRRLVVAYGLLKKARDDDRASMVAWRAEAELDLKACQDLTACLADEAAA